MSDILFIGPVAETGGPAIKNRILVDYLQKSASMKVWNTYDKSFKARVGAIASILFAKQKYMIIAVSRKGRNLLYPVLLLKQSISQFQYSCVVIGGNPVQSFKGKKSIEAMRLADVVTVETNGIKAQLEETYKLQNVHWMPNYKESVKWQETVSPQSFQNMPLRLLFLSSMRNEKGVWTLLRAFRKCRESGMQIELDFYGPIRKDLDRNFLDEVKATTGANYCGEVHNADVLRIMSQYHVFVFPTECTSEGFPAVLVEAQCAGLPVIASDINYNGEIIRDGINGFIFPHGDVDLLAERINYCYEQREKLAQISTRNIQDAQQYDAEFVIGKYCNVLKAMGWPV